MNGRNPDSGFWQVIAFAAAILLCFYALPGQGAEQLPPMDAGMSSLDLREILANW